MLHQKNQFREEDIKQGASKGKEKKVSVKQETQSNSRIVQNKDNREIVGPQKNKKPVGENGIATVGNTLGKKSSIGEQSPSRWDREY